MNLNWRSLVAGMGIASLVLLALTSIIYPFCLIRETGYDDGQNRCCSGRIRWWHPNTHPVPITINRAGSRQAPGEATANAVRRAMQAWTAAVPSYFEFSDGGLTDKDFHADDGINIVVFDVAGTNFAVGTSVLAFSRTITRNDNLGYRAYDSDMVFNARDYDWTVERGGMNSFDIETVSLHELGHHLGLDHAGGHRDISAASSGCGPVLQQAIMYYAVSPGSVRRSLHADDIAGLTQLYPRWVVEGTVTHAISNQPVPNAAVQFSGTSVPTDTVSLQTIRTDDNGRFRVPVVDSALSISVPQFGFESTGQSALTFFTPGTQTLSFELSPLPATSIEGNVRNRSEAISARVGLYAEGGLLQQTTTDANGRYVFSNLAITDLATTVYDSIRIEPELPYPIAVYHDDLTLRPGAPTLVNFELAPAEILLVDDDQGASFERFVVSPLQRLGMSYVAWDVNRKGAVGGQFSLFRDKPIIWLTGSRTNGFLPDSEIQALRQHLASGGSVFISGQNVAEHLNSRNSTFLSDILHVRWGGNVRDPILHGVTGDPIGSGIRNIAISGGDGGRNQDSQDTLVPDSIAQVVVVYDTTRGTVAGVRVEEAIAGVSASRVVFFGFGIEAVNNQPRGFATREQILSSVITWLSGISTSVASPRDLSGEIDDYALLPNYPNPFNGNTLIRFRIPARSGQTPVTIKVFDMLGRETRTLLTGTMSPGLHKVNWDGRNQRGVAVASGVYFFRMQAGGFEQVRKMMYVR